MTLTPSRRPAVALPRASTVRLVGREGAITISRQGQGEVTVALAGRRSEDLLPRAAAELSLDLGRLRHLVVDARAAEGDCDGASRWADAHRDRAGRVTFLSLIA